MREDVLRYGLWVVGVVGKKFGEEVVENFDTEREEKAALMGGVMTMVGFEPWCEEVLKGWVSVREFQR